MIVRSKCAALVVAVVLVVAVLAATAVAQKQSKNAPKFFTPRTDVELGEFIEGTDIEYVFAIRNHGLAELHINSVRPG
jgi:arabinogalactan endo-1,4-beta-galactosidase